MRYRLNKVYKSGGKLYADVDVEYDPVQGVATKGKKMAAAGSRGSMTAEEYGDLVGASVRLGFTPDDLDCALGVIEHNGKDETPVRWRLLRLRLDQEVNRHKSK